MKALMFVARKLSIPLQDEQYVYIFSRLHQMYIYCHESSDECVVRLIFAYGINNPDALEMIAITARECLMESE